jgi:pteridine reductase
VSAPAPLLPRGQRPVAIITGAARRVGRATALELAKAGCDTVITYRQSAQEAAGTLQDIRALGVDAFAEQLDLSDPVAVEALARRWAQSLPRADILVHNASEYGATPLADITPEYALRHYRVNALAPLLLSQRLAPLLARSTLPGGGAIVAMCDIMGLGRPRKNYTAYGMSKAALAEMVTALARELAPSVRVNGVAPGVVTFPEQGEDADPKMQAAYLSRVPLARAGTPEDAAEAVRWLALDARYTTGEIIRIDGGRWVT